MAVTLDSTASSPTATNLVVFPEELGGRVATVAGPTVMLTDKRGTDTVIVSPSTKYSQKGADPTGVSDGEVVTVFGLPGAGTPGELDAEVLAISTRRLPRSRRSGCRNANPSSRTPPTTTAVTPGGHVGNPQGQLDVPRTPAHSPGIGGWSSQNGLPVHASDREPRLCRDIRTPRRAQPQWLRWSKASAMGNAPR